MENEQRQHQDSTDHERPFRIPRDVFELREGDRQVITKYHINTIAPRGATTWVRRRSKAKATLNATPEFQEIVLLSPKPDNEARTTPRHSQIRHRILTGKQLQTAADCLGLALIEVGETLTLLDEDSLSPGDMAAIHNNPEQEFTSDHGLNELFQLHRELEPVEADSDRVLFEYEQRSLEETALKSYARAKCYQTEEKAVKPGAYLE